MVGLPVLCLAICDTVFKNKRKSVFKNLTQVLSFLIVVMSRNELGDGTDVDTGWFLIL